MKILCIADIHGKTTWREIIRKHPDVDHIVFLGDYFDDYGKTTAEHQINNFLEICELKKSFPITMLIGNHDFHYITDLPHERYSGYQQRAAVAICDVLIKNTLQRCFTADGVLYSHAGVTKTWLYGTGFTKEEYVEDYINKLPLNSFRFTPDEHCDMYGDSITQSTIWVRPKSLLADALPFKQVVGHTRQDDITIDRGIAFCDALEHGKYLIVDDGEFKPMSL